MIYAVSGRVIPLYNRGKRHRKKRKLMGYAYDVSVYCLEYTHTKRPTWRYVSSVEFHRVLLQVRPDNRLYCKIQVNQAKVNNTTGYSWVDDLRPGKPLSKRDALVLFPETKDMPEPIVQDYVRDRC